jgi:hypothetical protein
MADTQALKLCTADGKWSTVNSTISAIDPASSQAAAANPSSAGAKSSAYRNLPLSGAGTGAGSIAIATTTLAAVCLFVGCSLVTVL